MSLFDNGQKDSYYLIVFFSFALNKSGKFQNRAMRVKVEDITADRC